MIFNLKSASVLAVAATAAMIPLTARAETTSFERDGVSYNYTTEVVNGRTVIKGKDNAGKSFRLVVGESRVRGNYNGTAINMSLSEVKPSLAAVAMR